ncbi:MAG: DEAD/DEAH box helicase [Ghiorsea sp.]|nr:DEAD/DEAH box helicase [Ghiorsea sp.]
MILTQDEVFSIFSAAYVLRGEDYYWKNKVKDLQVVEEKVKKVILESSVEGSGRRLYTQETVVKRVKNKLSVSGYCSCPLSYNCKHVIAALIAYMEDQTPTVASVDAWLESFVQTLDQQDSVGSLSHISNSNSESFLAYVLEPSNDGIIVSFFVVKPLKRGGLNKGKPVDIQMLSGDWYLPAYVTEADENIIHLLASFRLEEQCKLMDEEGFVALNRMVKTGRCFWLNHHSQPLSLSGARSCQQNWQYDEQGFATFTLQVEPQAHVVPTRPTMYIDEIHYQVGSLPDLTLTGEQIDLLLNMPKVPADTIDAFSLKLAQHCPAKVVKPPKAMDVLDISGETPQPCVLFKWHDMDGERCRVGRVRMAYAGHEVCFLGPGPRVMLQQGDQLVGVERDLVQEEVCLEQLLSLEMQYCSQDSNEDVFFFFPLDDNEDIEQVWLHFLEHAVPWLKNQGWQVDIEDGFAFEQQDVDTWFVDVEEQGQGWFDLRFDVEVNGEKRALLPLLVQTLAHYNIDNIPDPLLLDLGGGKYTRIAKEKIMPMLQTIYELYDFQGDTTEILKVSRFESAALSDLTEKKHGLVWQGGEYLQDMAQKLKHFSGIDVVEPPKGLQATLRPYQQQGLNWLQFLRAYDFNGILADDMGLGKTVQALAHLLLEKESGRMDKPSLIIVPTSLVSNWKREAAQFTPDLKVLTLQGSERAQHFDSIADYDVVISTYPLLRFDSEVLLSHDYHLLILDEAQVIKNAKTKAAGLVRSIKAKHCLCVTGTPMENHLGELWSLFDFLMPEFLGDVRTFNRVFRKPIEKEANHDLQQRLNQRIKPFMLRRAKNEVATELPEKIEIIRSVTLSEKQAMLYESIRVSMEEKVRKTIASKGLARSHITILDALLKLRQVCCDPRILSLKQAQKLEESAKLELLMEMLPELLEEGRRVLLFSQFTKMLALIEGELKDKKISYSKLTGQTKNRDAAIEKFKQGEADVFLISLKAGGVGLNLTEADTVIHYDPWWNPAAENQATDRAHRIGQDKQVFVYKLVVENSVEEKIIAMQAKKQALADAVYAQGKGGEKALPITAEDMQDLFAPLK